MTFYLKYRPQTVDELDLESVRNQIKALAASEAVPHAFLFAGPRGTGKTSAARILAKLVNCEKPVKTKNGVEPCNACDSCLAISLGHSMDVIELDTASNRGIDDIRVLRETISLSPAAAKKKIYIMDEAHMLTTEAANAFLKTLEEPPAHAIFILATTDPQKLPETVRSRLTTVQFQKASAAEVSRQLARVIEGEGLEIEKGVVELIAKKADGSFRDAVKMLEALVLAGGKITKKKTEEMLFSTNLISAEELLKFILDKDTKSALSEIQKYSSAGGSTRDLIDSLQELLREKLLAEPSPEIISLIKFLFEARGNLARSFAEELPLELAIIEWAASWPALAELGKKKDLPKTEKKTDDHIDPEAWRRILTETKSKNVSLEALLRSARPVGLDGNTINIAVYYKFHKERLETEQYRRMFESVVEEVLGLTPARVVCVLEDPPRNEPEAGGGLTEAKEVDIIKAAEEIFGE